MGRLGFERLYSDGPVGPGVAGRLGGLDRLRSDSERAPPPNVPRARLRPGDVRAYAYAGAVAGGAVPDSELLHRIARLSPRSGRLGPGASIAHHDGLNPLDNLVSLPGAAALLATHWRRRLRRLPVVDVLCGQLHEQRRSRVDDRLLGFVRGAVPACLPARRGGGPGPPRFILWRGACNRLL